MKISIVFLMAAALLAMTPSAGADNAIQALEVTPTVQAEQTLTTDAEALASQRENCVDSNNLITSPEWAKGTNASSQTCGTCSSPRCNGATRGQACRTGGGWGYCDIFSGGHLCPAGGWSCQCSYGGLP